jgi:hypothetical protein
MHAGLKANLLFRRRNPPAGPALHSLSTQKPHFLDEPLLRRVSLHEVSLSVPYRRDDRRHTLAQIRMALKKAKRASSLTFVVAMVGPPLPPNPNHSSHNVESHPRPMVSMTPTPKRR